MSDECTVGTVANAVGGELHGNGSGSLSDAVHNSDDSRSGALFCAIAGFQVDGHNFVEEARRRGAAAALVERLVDVDLPQIVVTDSRMSMAAAAAEIHGHPSREVKVIGITGTNGKTTATYMLESIASSSGISSGRIGTLGATINGAGVTMARTTPEATDLQRLIAQMVAAGVVVVAMEVSSHAMALHRADAIDFAVVAFTNLSQDHLDFHTDMDEYFSAKARLFDGRATTHVVGTFDAAGRSLVGIVKGPTTTVGFKDSDDVRATNVEAGLDSSTFTLHIRDASAQVTARPGGRFNVENALVAAACADAVGISLGQIGTGLAATPRIPGRLDVIEAGQPFTVVVDYAHSPAGVETVVRTAREACLGSVIAVVGSAGDRDAAKRPLMGAAAALAHIAVITSDNPRSEDPDELVAAVVAGTAHSEAEIIVEVDRTAAIHLALDRAQPDDVVLILGKGHEQGQDFGDTVLPFDDRDVAATYLAQRWAS